MEDTTTPEAGEVIRTFVQAYPGWVRRHLPGVEAAALTEAIETGREWLEHELRTVLRRPFAEQRRGPLEIFQAAMRFPTMALDELGIEPPARTPEDAAVFPDDRYALVPASSQDLGEDAWRAHIAWGVAKAQAVAGAVPAGSGDRTAVVAVVGGSVEDRALISEEASQAHLRVALWRNPGAVARGLESQPPLVVLVDLGHPAAHDAIRACADAGTRTIAFGTDVDDLAEAGVMALGAETVIERSSLRRSLAGLLPKLV